MSNAQESIKELESLIEKLIYEKRILFLKIGRIARGKKE